MQQPQQYEGVMPVGRGVEVDGEGCERLADRRLDQFSLKDDADDIAKFVLSLYQPLSGGFSRVQSQSI
jgi:hypothetical protein